MEYTPFKGRDKMYDSVQAFIQSSEEKIIRTSKNGSLELAIGLKIPITVGDIAFLVEEIYGGKSAVTGLATKLVLIRWKKPDERTLVQIGSQKSSDLRLRDLVCMTKEEAARHQKEILQGEKASEELYDSDIIRSIEARMKEAEVYEKRR